MKIMQMALLKHAAHHRERQAQEEYRDQQRGAPAGSTSTSAAMHRDLADEYERLAEQYDGEHVTPTICNIVPARIRLDGIELAPMSWQECGPDWVDMISYDVRGNQMWHDNGMPIIERRTGKVEIIGRDVPDELGGVAL